MTATRILLAITLVTLGGCAEISDLSGDDPGDGETGAPDAGGGVSEKPDAGAPATDQEPSLADVWAGRARFAPDDAFAPPAGLDLHSETTTVELGGAYIMYYRVGPTPGATAGLRIAAATSADGDHWDPAGVVLSPGPGGSIDDVSTYAPSAMVHDGRVWMVYEADPGTGQTVAAAVSDDGTQFEKLGTVIARGADWEAGNVGTPSLHRFDGEWVVFYHGYTGRDEPGCFARGFARGAELTSLIKHGRPVLHREPRFEYLERGPGRGDIVEEDGVYYMVVEGLKGSSACGGAKTGWGLARSTDLVHWEHSSQNPMGYDAEGGCGEDMPAWQILGDRTRIVVTRADTMGVKRYQPVWTTCTAPGEETCNQRDDDCDGEVDEIGCDHEAVTCRVFGDGYSDMTGMADAVYAPSSGVTCVPGEPSTSCRKWLGRCRTSAASDGHAHDVWFGLFASDTLQVTKGSDAVLPSSPNSVCIPDGTASGSCRQWFGLGYTTRTQDHSHGVRCSIFDDGYANQIGPSDAIFWNGSSFCVPDGTATGTCRRWFGRCRAD